MVILFLSKNNSCRSQIAEAILRKYDSLLKIYSAGIEPVGHISEIAIEIMEEIGIEIKQHNPHHYSEYSDIEIDYLITVSEGTLEEFEIPDLKYKQKMHLTLDNPYKKYRDKNTIRNKCRNIRDELQIEMEYFYNKILKDLL